MALPRLTAFTQYGEHGVDLFFVLSGWLIGGLLWREHEKFGNVQITRFICRRALRTVPPYLVALAIFYIGVFVTRHERFDWGYLLFLQNYYQNISYFHISWSLCVEEHFYLVMPMIALAVSTRIGRAHTLLLIPALFPIFFRALEGNAYLTSDFGYYHTATHLRYEGLLLGVWASFLFQKHSDAWRILRRIAPFALALSVAALVSAVALGGRGRYIFFYFATALTLLIPTSPPISRKDNGSPAAQPRSIARKTASCRFVGLPLIGEHLFTYCCSAPRVGQTENLWGESFSKIRVIRAICG